jgi:hypothetical protein
MLFFLEEFFGKCEKWIDNSAWNLWYTIMLLSLGVTYFVISCHICIGTWQSVMYNNGSHCDLYILTLKVKIKKVFFIFTSLYDKRTADWGMCIVLAYNTSIIMADITVIYKILTNGEIVHWKKFLPGCT